MCRESLSSLVCGLYNTDASGEKLKSVSDGLHVVSLAGFKTNVIFTVKINFL
jgi:hypothetical protein